MSEEQIAALVQHWLEAELDYAEDCRVMTGPVSDDQREGYLEGLSIMSDEAHEGLLGNDYRKIEQEAGELLKAAGLSLDHAGPDFKRLCRRLLLAKVAQATWASDVCSAPPLFTPSFTGLVR